MNRLCLMILLSVCFSSVVAYTNPWLTPDGKIRNVQSIRELDDLSDFSFVVIGPNRGLSPYDSATMDSLDYWLGDSDCAFIIGSGDHIKRNGDNTFLDFIRQDSLWKNTFYPGIAGGENEYYGKNRGDSQSGAMLFDAIGLKSRDNVHFNETHPDYHAIINHKGWEIHLIQLHYPDTPQDPIHAFTQDSRDFLTSTLQSIEKKQKTLIICMACGTMGSWVHLLRPEEQILVMEKADLVLTAGTMFSERIQYGGFKDKVALCLNAGSPTTPAFWCHPGFIQVHVLDNPPTLVAQYQDLTKPARDWQNPWYAWVKTPGGGCDSTNFSEILPELDPRRVVAIMEKPWEAEEMISSFRSFVRQETGADTTFVQIAATLAAGEIRWMDLWFVQPYNNEMMLVSLDKGTFSQLLGFEPSVKADTVKVAFDHITVQMLKSRITLTDSQIHPTGLRLIPLIEAWARKQGLPPPVSPGETKH